MSSDADRFNALLGDLALAASAILVGSILIASPVLGARSQAAAGAGLLFGRVVDGDSERSVPEARVALLGRAEWILTDRNGRFAFFDLPPGTYRLVVSKPGYATTGFGETWADANLRVPRPGEDYPHRQIISLAANERRAGLVVRLRKHAAITGRVVDELGDPVVGVQIQAWPRVFRAGRSRLSDALPAISRTDDRGIYRIGQLLPGQYAIGIHTLALTTPIGLSKVDERESWNVDAYRLRRAHQDGLGGAVNDRIDRPGGWVETVFGLSAAPDSGAARRGYISTFYPGVGRPSDAQLVQVAEGQEVAGIDFNLQPVDVRSVAGQVMGPDGKPVSNVAVRLIAAGPDADVEVGLGLTSSNGTFFFTSIPRGSYQVEVLEVPHSGRPQFYSPLNASPGTGLLEFRTDPWSDQDTLWASTPVSVGDADVHDLRIDLRPGARVSGVVRFEADRMSALDGVRLILEPVHGRLAKARPSRTIAVAPSGQFRSIGLRPGLYYLRATQAPPGWQLSSAMVAGRDASMTPLEIRSEPLEGVVVTFAKRAGELTGFVRDARGAPDTRASVVAFPANPSAWIDYGENPRHITFGRVDLLGRYRLSGLPAGDYCIAAVDDGALARWHSPDLFLSLSRIASRVRVGHAQQVLDLVIQAVP